MKLSNNISSSLTVNTFWRRVGVNMFLSILQSLEMISRYLPKTVFWSSLHRLANNLTDSLLQFATVLLNFTNLKHIITFGCGKFIISSIKYLWLFLGQLLGHDVPGSHTLLCSLFVKVTWLWGAGRVNWQFVVLRVYRVICQRGGGLIEVSLWFARQGFSFFSRRRVS